MRGITFKAGVSDFEMEIGVLLIGSLNLHEETIESELKELEKSIKESKMILDPVIVDKGSNSVLDGMHRVSALSRLGHDKIPVCLVDYLDSEIKLGSWCRVFPNLSISEALDIGKNLGFDFEKCSRDIVSEDLKKDRSKFFFVSDSECYSYHLLGVSINEIFLAARKIENILSRKGYEPTLEPDIEVLNKIHSNEAGLIIPPATKDEVIEISRSDSVFPPKMTRHVIPARPLNVKVPLNWLEEDLDTVNEKIVKELESREIEYLSPGSEFAGRKYEEELIVFKDTNK